MTTPTRIGGCTSFGTTPTPPKEVPRSPALQANSPGSGGKHDVEVLMICCPQNDFLHAKGATNLSLDPKSSLSWMKSSKRMIDQIKLLKKKRMFDHCIVVKRHHYGNNLSFASCMVGSSYDELVHYNCNQSVSTTVMPDNCVFGRWGSEIYEDLIDENDHHVVVGMEPLIGEPSPFTSFDSKVRLRHGILISTAKATKISHHSSRSSRLSAHLLGSIHHQQPFTISTSLSLDRRSSSEVSRVSRSSLTSFQQKIQQKEMDSRKHLGDLHPLLLKFLNTGLIL